MPCFPRCGAALRPARSCSCGQLRWGILMRLRVRLGRSAGAGSDTVICCGDSQARRSGGTGNCSISATAGASSVTSCVRDSFVGRNDGECCATNFLSASTQYCNNGSRTGGTGANHRGRWAVTTNDDASTMGWPMLASILANMSSSASSSHDCRAMRSGRRPCPCV